jgi:TRAP-type C4-dicarboxylate transport system permease small subunit
LNSYETLVARITAILKWVGITCLAGMMLTTGVDVVFRAINKPIWGLVEAASLLAVLVLGCALPLAQRERAHVVLDMVVRRFSFKTAAKVDACGHLVGAAFFRIVSWRCWVYAQTLHEAGELTMSLEFPLHLMVRGLCVAFGVLAVVLATDCLAALQRAVRS